MDPLKTSYSDLVRPHLPEANKEEQELFLSAIQATSTPGTNARFWRKKSHKDQTGKWVLPGYSGSIQEDNESRRLVILDPASKKIATQDKVIKFGIEILVLKKGENGNEVHLTEIVFKKWACSGNKKPTPGMYYSIEEHQRYYSEIKEGISSPPIIICERYSTKKERFYIDFIEKRAIQSLNLNHLPYRIKVEHQEVQFTLKDLAKGMKEVAQALIHLKGENRVHTDVKYSNILITHDGKGFHLGLADFELLSDSGYFFEGETQVNYPFWDTVRRDFHIATRFCDVYGFAQSLGCLLWGREYERVANNSHLSDFDKFYSEWKERSPIQDQATLEFYNKVYLFIRRAKEQNQARGAFLSHPTIQAALSNEAMRPNILKVIEIDNLEAEDCFSLALELELLFIK